jgi:hypothetical protein
MPLVNMNMRHQVQALFTHAHIKIAISSNNNNNKDEQPALSMLPASCGHEEEDDDNASVASTVTAMSLSSQEEEDEGSCITRSLSSSSSSSSLSSSNNKSTKKSVCFDESRNVAYDNAQGICHEDCQEFWYSAQDYCQFKQSTYLYGEAIVLASEQQQQQHCGGGLNSYERVIKRVYLACCQQPATDEMEEDGTDDDMILSLPLARQLNRWMCSSTAVNRLGMERLLVRQIRKDRSQRRKNVVRAVLAIQEEFEHNQWNPYYCTDIDVAERMRQASERLSLPSRHFSRHMAQAQGQCCD